MNESLTSKKPVDGYYCLATNEVNENLERIVELDIPLRRKRKDGSYSFIPPKDFNIFLKNQEMDFYIDDASFIKLVSKEPERKEQAETHTIIREPAPGPARPAEIDRVYQKEIQKATELDITERIQSIMNHNFRMNGMIEKMQKFDPGTIGEVSDIFVSTLCINKATMVENLDARIPQDNMNKIITGSHALIDNLLKLMAKGKASFRDLARLEHIKTGSTTLNHMNRLLIRFIAFLFFYNSYFQKFSNDVKKFRAHFKDSFYQYYDRILKGSQQINLEIVFKDGIAPVQERWKFIDYVMGGFMHDIGKIPEISYHDGNEAFDPKKARRHVFDSFNMLLETRELSLGVVSTGLLHHDYYDAPYGYRQLETFRKKFTERRERSRDNSPLMHFISYSINDVGYGKALAYFPNKIMEILDVYDAMTDPEKKYRAKPFTPEEAVRAMRKEYIEAAHPGMDPILFLIFIDFLRAGGELSDPSVAEEMKTFGGITP